MKNRIIALFAAFVMALSLLSLPAASGSDAGSASAAACRAVSDRGTSYSDISPGIKVTWFVELHGISCPANGTARKVTVQYAVVGYSRPAFGLEGCNRVQGITANISSIADYNPPTVTVPCTNSETRKRVELPNRALAVDRGAFADFKSRVRRHPDLNTRTSSATL